MNLETILSRPPLGVGSELIKARYCLPINSVKNRVDWVNRDLRELPFDLRVGEPCDFGIFLTESWSSNPIRTVEVAGPHGRSAIFGRVIFADKFGNYFRDIDLKGIGSVQILEPKSPHDPTSVRVGEVAPIPKRKGETYGILDLRMARSSVEMARKLLKATIVTYAPIALISLQEICVGPNGEKISVEEAKEKKIIDADVEPGIEVRGFTTKSRIEDLLGKHKDLYLRDAMSIVADRVGADPNEFNAREYFKWFAASVAFDLAVLHMMGHYHKYLTAHNITLDARIVDLDSVRRFSKNEEKRVKQVGYDLLLARETLQDMYINGYPNHDDDTPELIEKVFAKIYEQTIKGLMSKI